MSSNTVSSTEKLNTNHPAIPSSLAGHSMKISGVFLERTSHTERPQCNSLDAPIMTGNTSALLKGC